jgi:glycosyltransferase involved in cell wall biosynthesis
MNDKTALIVIPTTGADTLKDAIDSVVSQTYKNISIWVIIDGPQYFEKSMKIIQPYLDDNRVKTMQLPENVGANGFYGHRIYAMSAFINNSDYWLALDQDNWFEPTHVETMIETCETEGRQWCHSLRMIHDKNGHYICDDNCESLGSHPTFLDPKSHLVDTSTYCVRKDVIVQIGQAWNGGWGQDRVFLANISHYFPNYRCTGKYTVSYRLDGNSGSVNADFFTHGNKIMAQRYPGGFPWKM